MSVLTRPADPANDHVRGGGVANAVHVVAYGDFLCPYCRRNRDVLKRLRDALGDRLAYAFRHFPNERAHPGAERLARAAEAAANQGRFWNMHDALFDREPPISEDDLAEIAAGIELDVARFEQDLESDEVHIRVQRDLADARRDGVTGTPTLYVDGLRYDGAWDFYSMLDALEQPVAERIHRSARAFANLPASGGLVLLLAALAALVLANSPFGSAYHAFIHASIAIGLPEGMLSLTVGEWFSEALLALFFLLVGLEIRRELTAGTLADPRAAALPVLSAIGGAIAPALIYLAINHGPAHSGWSVPTATDVAFTLGVLAVLGGRVPPSLRVFVAALAVGDDLISVVTLAIFYPQHFAVGGLAAAAATTAAMLALQRSRVFAVWPYAVLAVAIWYFLHAAGVHGALAGIVLAALLPTRPAPAAGPLLAQAATALAALEHAERELDDAESTPVFEWASRNLSAASGRLLSTADRVERAIAPWSSYVVLPLFAFAATGVELHVDVGSGDAGTILSGVVLGLVVGKPLGVCTFAWIGAACLCGIGYTMSLLMAEQAFSDAVQSASTAKIGVLIGSVVAAALGVLILTLGTRAPGGTESSHATSPKG